MTAPRHAVTAPWQSACLGCLYNLFLRSNGKAEARDIAFLGESMYQYGDGAAERALSRRQFGLLLGWGAVLVATPGVYGIVARSPANLATRVSTAFGSIAAVRAGRLARLDGLGKPAFSGLAAAVSIIEHGGGVLPVKMAQAAGGGHGHGGGASVPSLPGSTEPMNLTWPDVVVMEVNIRNDGQGTRVVQPRAAAPEIGRNRNHDHAAGFRPHDGNSRGWCLREHICQLPRSAHGCRPATRIQRRAT